METNDLYRQIILDHYKNPQNQVKEKPEGYIEARGLNPSCGDELVIYVKIENNIIEDIKYQGNGCSICCSSASIMTNELHGLNSDNIKNKITNFQQLLEGEQVDETLFEDALAYSGIAKFPARFKCAFLSWKTMKEIIEKNNL